MEIGGAQGRQRGDDSQYGDKARAREGSEREWIHVTYTECAHDVLFHRAISPGDLGVAAPTHSMIAGICATVDQTRMFCAGVSILSVCAECHLRLAAAILVVRHHCT